MINYTPKSNSTPPPPFFLEKDSRPLRQAPRAAPNPNAEPPWKGDRCQGKSGHRQNHRQNGVAGRGSATKTARARQGGSVVNYLK